MYTHVKSVLEQSGIAVNDLNVDKNNRDTPYYQRWTVEPDVSISGFEDYEEFDLASGRRWHYIGVEVTTRKLLLGDDLAAFEELRTAISVIKKTSFVLNIHTTGLHVHVGICSETSDSLAYTLPCLKRFAQLVTVLEHQIESLHPDNRAVNEFAGSPSTSLWGGPMAAVKILEAISDLETFVETMSPTKHHAYNFMNLSVNDKEKKSNTIEFRQDEGTMDADTIVNWAQFVMGLVRFAYLTEPAEFAKRIRAEDLENVGILDLMDILGMAEGMVAHYQGRTFDRPRKAFEHEKEEEDEPVLVVMDTGDWKPDLDGGNQKVW